MGAVILYGSASGSATELVLLLHRIAERAPDLAPSDITREGELLHLQYEAESERRQPVVLLHLSRAGERTVVPLESSGSEGIDRRAQTLVRQVLRMARGEELE